MNSTRFVFRAIQSIIDAPVFSPLVNGLMALSDARLRRKGWRSNYERYQQQPDRPTWIEIESTNICNANCVFCGYQFQERRKRVMSNKMFEDIIRQYAEIGGGDIQLTPIVGEALVDPGFAGKVAFARSFSQIKKLHLTTNAILLTKDKFEELAQAGLNKITISISGLDPEEYRRVYRKDHLAEINANLRKIAESPMIKQCPVTLSLRSDDRIALRRDAVRALKTLGLDVTRIQSFDNWSGKIMPKDLSGSMLIRPNRTNKRIPCSVLYDGPMVSVDGRMTACGCRDINVDSELFLGTFPETPLDQPYADGTVEALRQRFINGDLPEICRSCRHYRPAY